MRRPVLRRFNFWSHVDARGAGEACRLALENAAPGHEAMIIAAAETIKDTSSADLKAEVLPKVALSGPLATYPSLCRRTRRAG